MGGGGFALDMIRKVRQNRALRKEKINRYKANSKFGRTSVDQPKVNPREFKKYSASELAAMKKLVRKEAFMEYYIPWIISIVVCGIAFGVLWYLT